MAKNREKKGENVKGISGNTNKPLGRKRISIYMYLKLLRLTLEIASLISEVSLSKSATFVLFISMCNINPSLIRSTSDSAFDKTFSSQHFSFGP